MKQEKGVENLEKGFNSLLERMKEEDLPYFAEIIKSVIVSLYELYRSPIFSNNYPFEVEKFK